MSTFTNTTNTTSNTAAGNTVKAPLSLATIVATLFAVNLREKLDAQTGGDKSDAAFTWGM